MSERGGLITSRYFEPRGDLRIGADDIVVVSCMRNELLRLPYFLEYYRTLGVNRFLLIDNDSDDGTREYLADQRDVEYFHTDTSYLGSANGRMWVQEVAETYATGRWVLFADVDELFVYPGVELFGIHDFCRYLDDHGYEGVFAVLLDLYSDLPLEQTTYRSGTDFRDTCHYFEVDSYRLQPADYNPFLSVWGGPRGRLAAGDPTAPKARFQQRKVPLVKWRKGFSFVVYAHDARYLPLADTTAALLHFKYFSTWVDRLAQDSARGDRNPRSYAFYADRADRDLCFYGSHSLRYSASRDLVRLGVLAASGALRQYYAGELESRGEDAAVVDALVPQALPAGNALTLRSIAALWPFANNAHVARYFGQLEPPASERRRLVREMSKGVDVVDVWDDHILVRLGQRVLHDWHSGGLALEVSVDGDVLDRAALDDTATTFEVDRESLIPNVYRWNVDVRGTAAPKTDRAHIEVRLVDLRAAADNGSPAAGIRVFSGAWQRRRVSTHDLPGYRGDVEQLAAGELRGWAFDARAQDFGLPIAIYLNGRLASFARPSEARPGLAAKLECARSAGRGFRVRLPIGYFRDGGQSSVRVEVRIAGRNVDLGRTPFDLPTSTDALSWDAGRGWVVPSPADPRATPAGRSAASVGRRRVATGRHRLKSALAAVTHTARYRLSTATGSARSDGPERKPR